MKAIFNFQRLNRPNTDKHGCANVSFGGYPSATWRHTRREVQMDKRSNKRTIVRVEQPGRGDRVREDSQAARTFCSNTRSYDVEQKESK